MAWKNNSRSKYGAKKVEVNGIVFDSKKEARRYSELVILQKAGAISDLKRQVKYVLIPAQYMPTGEVYQKGAMKGYPKKKMVERECSYIADFVYNLPGSTEPVVEDAKGMRTKEYIIKRKLMLHVHGIKIKEV